METKQLRIPVTLYNRIVHFSALSLQTPSVFATAILNSAVSELPVPPPPPAPEEDMEFFINDHGEKQRRVFRGLDAPRRILRKE